MNRHCRTSMTYLGMIKTVEITSHIHWGATVTYWLTSSSLLKSEVSLDLNESWRVKSWYGIMHRLSSCLPPNWSYEGIVFLVKLRRRGMLAQSCSARTKVPSTKRMIDPNTKSKCKQGCQKQKTSSVLLQQRKVRRSQKMKSLQ